jgi:hypothetical protein
MASLMDDPAYRAYMKTVPITTPQLAHGEPWQLWLRREDDGKWLTRRYTSYREVWPVFVAKFRDPAYDPTITSRRVFFAPPGEWYDVRVKKPRKPTPADKRTTVVVTETRWRQTFFWDGYDLEWCGRCRRPVFWQALWPGHHAIRLMPAMTTEDNVRCVICGIRRIAMPPIDQMVR